MTEWRDRGFVPDSDDEEISLDSPSTSSTTRRPSVELSHDKLPQDHHDISQNHHDISQNHHEISQVHHAQHDISRKETRTTRDELERDGNTQLHVDMQEVQSGLNKKNQTVAENHISTSDKDGKKASEQSPGQPDSPYPTQDAADEQGTLQNTRPAVTKTFPIVLIESRPSPSPIKPTNKNVRTYSKKFNPLASRSLVRSTSNANNPPPATRDDLDGDHNDDGTDLMDVDNSPQNEADHNPTDAPGPIQPTLAAQRRSSISSSSDLSDVDMEVLSSSPFPFFPQASVSGPVNRAPSINQTQDPDSRQDTPRDILSDHDLAAMGATRRNFRSRKAIQLHPYMLENEQYRRFLKARGLRPVLVAQNSQRPRDQQDTQDAEFLNQQSQSQNRNASHTQETTPPDSSASSNAAPRNNLLDLIANDENEFPDIDAALRRNIIGGVQQGFKRRKTLETPNNRALQNLPSSTSGARGKLKSLNLTRRHSGTGNNDLLPLSPPRTSSPSIADPTPVVAPPQFRYPKGLTPADVPTPVQSSPERITPASERRSRQIVVSSDDDDQANDDNRSDGSPSEESDAEERQLLRMRRKIRGVLPASWLKLDKQTRVPPSTSGTNIPHHDAPQPSAAVRGVAQRKISSKSSNAGTPSSQRGRIEIFDNSDASDSSADARSASRLVQSRLPPPLDDPRISWDDRNGEVEEHDEIDPMFTSSARPRVQRNDQRKRQPRITDLLSEEHGQGSNNRSHRTSEHAAPQKSRSKPASMPKPRSKRQPKFRKPPQLSILDAAVSSATPPELTTSSSHRTPAQPAFIRLATRQARNRPDQGRHSPTNKTIRLATREDTQEATEPLRAWRSGALSTTKRRADGQRERSSHTVNATSASGRSNTTSRHQSLIVDLTTEENTERARPAAASRSERGSTSGHAQGQEVRRNAQGRARPDHRAILQRNHRMRPAQLETVGDNDARNLDLLTFAAPPSRLMEIFSRDRGAVPASRFRLERFLKDRGDLPDTAATTDDIEPMTTTPGDTAKPGRVRKRLAQRLDVELSHFRQPDEPLPADVPSVVIAQPIPAVEAETLQGLGTFGTRYPIDFDVRPLELGTYFATSTFIGSGDFDDCLTLRNRDLDVPAGGRITIQVCDKTLTWSAWDEEVSTGLTAILKACADDLQQIGALTEEAERVTALGDMAARFNYFLRSIIRYLSGCLHYTDPIDRASSIIRLTRFVDEFSDMAEEKIGGLKSLPELFQESHKFLIDTLIFMLCLTAQLVRIARHPAADSGLLTSLQDRSVKISHRLVVLAMPHNLAAVRVFLEEHRQHNKRDSGIQEHDVAIKTVVTVNHVLKSIEAPSSLADILATRLGHSIGTICNINALDQVWYDAFSVQPILEIDTRGIFRPKSRFNTSNDNWTLIKSLIQRTFDLYPATSKTRNLSLNNYVRACLKRIYHLVVRWGWRRCEPGLSTVYDFFARNTLSQLPKEDGKGSPKFLEDLDKTPPIELESNDCAFHIFLKLLVVGLRGMQEIYPKNKIRGFAWRFIPNHGRTYRKDQDLTQVALDALRNHHDLLCTLYWVLPPSSGPRLQMIQDLVDHKDSHREACRLSVRSWGILARYQVAQEEQLKDLEALASWFKDMVAITITQYRLARSEAEDQYAQERAKGSVDISTEVLESTIATNQRGILATLLDLLQAMRQALKASKSWNIARSLIENTAMMEVLTLFDIDQPRLVVAVTQALDVVAELLSTRTRLNIPAQQESQQGSDDSQEYGDWSFMDQVAESEPVTPERSASDIVFLQEPLANLLSTCFGSEHPPDDELLQRLVDVWTRLAHQIVKDGARDWTSYLDTYSSLSWFQLRETEQRHKYTPCFLSSVIDKDQSSLNNNRQLFMQAWLTSLLDRESMLKFQHTFTARLLEKAVQEPLLHNLPFAADHRTGNYHITLSDIRDRRISLIGSILSNIRNSWEEAMPTSELRREYTDMLKHAMQHMRTTYQQLQDMSTRLGSSHHDIRGAYVTFVQQVISFMQQYTTDICPVDSFFVDSSAFPLPVNDPTYVVGRLKGYISKLTAGARKQLSVFVQTVSGRSAVDNQQPYLVGQLHQALTGRPSRQLRTVFMTAILPAYVKCAMETACGWILALPLIEACALVMADLVYDIDLSDETALQGDVETLTDFLQTLYEFAFAVASNTNKLYQNTAVRILNKVFVAVEACLTPVEYIHHSVGNGDDALKLLNSFVELDQYLCDTFFPKATPSPIINDGDNQIDQDDEYEDDLMDFDTTPLLPDTPSISNRPCQYQDTLDFCKKDLNQEVKRNWRSNETGCIVLRGGQEKEVLTDICDVEEEKNRLRMLLMTWRRSWNQVFGDYNAGVELEVEGMVDGMAEILWG